MLARLGDYQTIEEQIRGKGIDVEKMMGEKEPIKSKRT
jgi:hypothetical protein